MPTFIAKMKVIHAEHWSVEAKNAQEARDKIMSMDGDVIEDEAGGEVIDWEIENLTENT